MNAPPVSNVVIAAVFDVEEDAVQGLDALREAGVRPEQVSVMMPDREGDAVEDDPGTHVAGGAASGATMGGIVGGLTGWLLGIGALAIPGIGPVLGAGVLGSILAGAAIGAAAGGLLGGLVSLGIPEEEARTYERHLQAGRVLVTVHPTEAGAAEQLRDVLEANGAYDVRIYETDSPVALPVPPSAPTAPNPPPPLVAPSTEPAGYTIGNTVDAVEEGPTDRGLTSLAPGPGIPGVSESSTSPASGPGEDLSGRSRDLTAVDATTTANPQIGAATATPYRSGGEAARSADMNAVRALTPPAGDRGLGDADAPPAPNRGPHNTDTDFRSGGAGSRGEETHG